MEIFNMYCDESCHLNYKDESFMGFSALVCNIDKIKEINQNLMEIKSKHNISVHQELKWSKISNTNFELYKDVINYFFIDDDLSFRTFIIKNKQSLKFNQKNTKMDFYYKIMYFMIIKYINPNFKYNIYLDIKDTNSSKRINNLKLYLNKAAKKIDYNVTNTISKIQTVRSYESNLLQLSDILLGAVMYANRFPDANTAKNKIVNFIKQKSGKKLTQQTLLNEQKFNINISDATKMKPRGENEL